MQLKEEEYLSPFRRQIHHPIVLLFSACWLLNAWGPKRTACAYFDLFCRTFPVVDPLGVVRSSSDRPLSEVVSVTTLSDLLKPGRELTCERKLL